MLHIGPPELVTAFYDHDIAKSKSKSSYLAVIYLIGSPLIPKDKSS